MLVTIMVISGLSVIPALLIRSLVDEAIPEKDLGLLTLLGIGMIMVPFINALVGVVQRWFSSRVGEGIIFDRSCLFTFSGCRFDSLQRPRPVS